MKMAGVLISACTIGLRTAVFPRWVAFSGYACALVLLVVIANWRWITLVSPLWMLLISVQIVGGVPIPSCQAAARETMSLQDNAGALIVADVTGADDAASLGGARHPGIGFRLSVNPFDGRAPPVRSSTCPMSRTRLRSAIRSANGEPHHAAVGEEQSVRR
jgi:hypothetical protein